MRLGIEADGRFDGKRFPPASEMRRFDMKNALRTSALVAAALAAAFTLAPVDQAEARNGRKGALIGGLAAGALIGGALLAAPRGYAAPAYGGPVYVDEGPTCYIVRERVWDDYRGRWVRVRREVCE
jgi:uncharacterized membrane protein